MPNVGDRPPPPADFAAKLVDVLTLHHDGGMVSASELNFRCPFTKNHNNGDSDPSAHYNIQRGVWNCFGCGEKGTWHGLAHQIGLQPPDSKQGIPPVVMEHVYRDRDGKPLFVVDRFQWPWVEPVIDYKTGLQKIGQNGKPRTKKSKCKPRLPYRPRGVATSYGLPNSMDKPLYRLPQLLALKPGSLLGVVEGEKDADNAAALGFAVTTNPFGATARDWERWGTDLKGLNVVLIADHDPAGYKRIPIIYEAIRTHAASVRVLTFGHLTGFPEKGDLSDWIARGGTWGGTASALQTMIDEAPTAEEWVKKNSDEAHIATTSTEQEVYECTELGNAKRLRKHFADKFQYIAQEETWIGWNNLFWERDETKAIVRAAQQLCELIRAEAKLVGDKQRLEYLKWAQASQSNGAVTAAITQASALDGMWINTQDLDKDRYLLGVGNGVVDLRDGSFRAANPADFLTRHTPIHYNDAAEIPHWNQSLGEYFAGFEDIATYLQELVGYSLTGDISDKGFIIFRGHGDTGKTACLEVIMALAGMMGGPVDKSLFLLPRPGMPHKTQFSLGNTVGMRVLIADDLEEEDCLDMGFFKGYTGGNQKLTVEQKFKKAYTHRPQGHFYLSSNHAIKIRATDSASWGRIREIPFNHRREGSQKVRAFAERFLFPELSGILTHWAIPGAVRWYQHGFTVPQAVRDAVQQHRKDASPLTWFIEDRCEFVKGASLDPNLLFDAWNAYRAQENIQLNWSQQMFSSRFRAATEDEGVVKDDKARPRVWLNVKLKTQARVVKQETGDRQGQLQRP